MSDTSRGSAASSGLSVSVGVVAPLASLVEQFAENFGFYLVCLFHHSFLTIGRSRSVGTERSGILCTLTGA